MIIIELCEIKTANYLSVDRVNFAPATTKAGV